MSTIAPHLLLAQAQDPSTTLLATHLLHEQFAVSMREDGRVLAQEIAKGPSPFDLILLDLSLPYYGGMQLLPLIRSTPGWETTPIILLSAQVEESHEILAFRFGASDYLQKPLRIGALVARIQARLGLTAQGA